jgi:hypothetical protein
MIEKSITLELRFRSLQKNYYSKTSERASKYNCVSYVANDYTRPWWPVPYPNEPGYYWPIENSDGDESLNEFVEGFESLGYKICENGELEENYTKIVIYIDENDMPSHMAKQLENGKWSSKCGTLEDIEHDLDALCGSHGDGYGRVASFMKKRK